MRNTSYDRADMVARDARDRRVRKRIRAREKRAIMRAYRAADRMRLRERDIHCATMNHERYAQTWSMDRGVLFRAVTLWTSNLRRREQHADPCTCPAGECPEAFPF